MAGERMLLRQSEFDLLNYQKGSLQVILFEFLERT